jgi:hypothetical protein
VRLAALKAAASHLIYISSHSILLIAAAARLPSPIAGITLALQRPCIFKRDPLCLYFLIVKENIVIAFAVKRRIDIDQVNRFILNIIP